MKWWLACLLVVARVAPVDADDRARAAEAFAAAQRAFEDEDYKEALRLFRAAFEAAPTATVRFNIGVCLERLGRFREAATEYDAAAEAEDLPAEGRARAREEAKRVRERLGKLTVSGAPAGATVRIDGVELCKLPCVISIDEGRHEVTAETRDASDRKTIVIARGVESSLALHAIAAPEQRGISWITLVGAGAAAIGTAGTIGFGLRAQSLHDQYLAEPTVETRDAGLFARNVANVSLAVAIVGVAAIAIDVFVLARRPRASAMAQLQGTGAVLEARF